MAKLIDLVGQRFGMWIVTARAENYRTDAQWLCLCDCGTESVVLGDNLRRGRSRGCRPCRLAADDMTGQRFGRLVVTGRASDARNGAARWHCRCDCGRETITWGDSLRRGVTRSCGCYGREQRSTHGLSKHPLYGLWLSMRKRCQSPTDPAYPRYGGRGIAVCERWESFANFLADVGDRPPNPPGWTSKKPYWSLDRIDNDGNYEPSNVRWASPETQSNNRRDIWANRRREAA